MTAVTNAVLFRSESKGSGFHANERPKGNGILDNLAEMYAIFEML